MINNVSQMAQCNEKEWTLEPTLQLPIYLPQTIQNWLTNIPNLQIIKVTQLPSDAGLRRYYRIHTSTKAYIVMDASQSHENCHAFVAIANSLREQHIHTPEIYAADLQQRYLLLSDLGDMTYFRYLQSQPQQANALYTLALKTLLQLQLSQPIKHYDLPIFSAEFMWQEWLWHKQWVIAGALSDALPLTLLAELDQAIRLLINSISQQPYVFMHRDYHSANLMVLPEDQVGVLDFQDAFIGPITYDLVSLLRDCYVQWPHAQILNWLYAFKAERLPHISDECFIQWVDYMSVQRHLKALMTFVRKALRDHNPTYLQHIPRTLHYLATITANYRELATITNYVNDYINHLDILCAP